MAAVIVTIAGRTYRLSCDDGQEPRLEQLARYVENKILSMRDSFKEIGEPRIVVMAALAIADEAEDSRNKVETTGQEVIALRAELEAAKKALAAMEAKVTRAVEDTAERLEALASDMHKPVQKDDFPF
ncbi:cell division protein ZapA [Methylocystis echinoides]|uniref:Cell division protein ZapA n=1 Tax=Methylocystis echinoides TaxID=29468 RepID=A0A9W6GPR8_9HYPH|nr:cell division protein ZapA [Methylocystis echinoides]GLI91031.1 cell division protein ZapA [Methylocystis echinoides]